MFINMAIDVGCECCRCASFNRLFFPARTILKSSLVFKEALGTTGLMALGSEGYSGSHRLTSERRQGRARSKEPTIGERLALQMEGTNYAAVRC